MDPGANELLGTLVVLAVGKVCVVLLLRTKPVVVVVHEFDGTRSKNIDLDKLDRRFWDHLQRLRFLERFDELFASLSVQDKRRRRGSGGRNGTVRLAILLLNDGISNEARRTRELSSMPFVPQNDDGRVLTVVELDDGGLSMRLDGGTARSVRVRG